MIRIFKTHNVLLAFMFFEIFLFPVWQLGPISFKISLIIIFFSLIKKTPKSSFVFPFLLMIIVLWIGKFYSYLFLDEIQFTQTLRITVNYSLIIAVFLYSKKIKNIDNFNWLASLAVLFSFINIFILIFGPENPSIISFYNLGDRIEEGLFLVRNPGIATNPNVSALMGNLILLFWVVSKKFNLITLKSNFWNIIVFISIGLAIISFVSKSGFFAYFIICIWYFKNNFSVRKLFYVFVSLLIPLFFIINFYNELPAEDKRVFEYGIENVINLDDAINDEIYYDDGSQTNRLVKLKLALEDFIISPLFGSGSDRSTGNILSSTLYHNDWAEILVSTGILGLLLFFIIVYRVYKVSYILLVPLIFPGMTNAFIFTMQIAAFYFLFVGLIYKSKTKLNYYETDSKIS